jgi:hypothetical protein
MWAGPRPGVPNTLIKERGLMTSRRTWLLTLTSGLVALVVMVAPVIADELLGVLTKVDVETKTLTVVEKDTDKEVKVTVNDETEVVTKKGNVKVDLDRVAKQLKKMQDAGQKGREVKITHEKNVASKIEYARKKAE